MANLKEIRDRIVSVKNTRKITEAMRLVAAAKVRRAQDQVLSRVGLSQINLLVSWKIFNLESSLRLLTLLYYLREKLKPLLWFA